MKHLCYCGRKCYELLAKVVLWPQKILSLIFVKNFDIFYPYPNTFLYLQFRNVLFNYITNIC
jgi:hypothetical protein